MPFGIDPWISTITAVMLSGPPLIVRRRDQVIAGALRIAAEAIERGRESVIADGLREAVGAQQQAIAGGNRRLAELDQRVGIAAERAQQDVLVLRLQALLAIDQPGLHLRFDERVIDRQRLEAGGVADVEPAVADMRDADEAVADPHADDGGAHAGVAQPRSAPAR